MPTRPFDARMILLIGLGGLLALMSGAGIYTIRSLSSIRTRHESIRARYLERNRTLNQVRSDLYLSSTYVRDYLLDPDIQTAEENRRRFEGIRDDLNSRIALYGRLVLPSQRKRWRELEESLDQYWTLLAPVWSWDQETRRTNGYEYYRNEVVTRRSHLLGIADEVGGFNEQQLTQGDRELDEVFDSVQQRLGIWLVVSLICGGVLALVSMAKLLTLERRAAEARAALQELSARLVSAQEEERKNISRELHDEVGQSLSALLVRLSNLRATVRGGEHPEFDEELSLVRRLAEESVRVVRNMALLLRPSMLDDLGLVAALQWQAREVSRHHGPAVTLEADNVPDVLPEQHSICIYRVVQEALHNVVRHSEAKRVTIRIRSKDSRLALSIRDDGKGFIAGTGRGMGILGMQERVTHLGGTFQVDSQPTQGTELLVTLPVPKEGPAST